MSDDNHRPEKEKSSPGLDLSGLNELSLGPQWGSGNLPEPKMPRGRTRDHDERPRSAPRPGEAGDRRGPPTRDRRGDRRPDMRRDSAGAPPRDGPAGPPLDRQDRRPRRDDRGDRRGPPQRMEAPFRPLLEADFYPDDAAFKALTHAIKTSCRTFELFEIAELILGKPERWVCVARHPEQKEGENALLVAAIKDGLPFLNEQAALNHVFTHYLGDFFEIEEYEGDPPAGSFQLVHRCGMTGELLAPPNYHRYAAIIRDHHADRLPNVPFERFQQRIESVRDEEAIQAWLDKMKKRVRYTLKPEFVPEGKEAPVFSQVEDARIYLIAHHKDKLVRPAYSVRIVGKDLALLPENDVLRRWIEALHEQQVHFPLATANNLRGRLRRLNFAVYKRGSKGVSFVCAVKRRFREAGEVLAENLSDLIAFIEAHPNLKAADLPLKYLGLAPEGGAAPGEAEKPAPAAAGSAAPAEPTAEAPAAAAGEPEPSTAAEVAPGGDEAAATSEPAAAPAIEEPATEPPPPASEARSVPSGAAPRLSADQEQVLSLRRDLRYLVTQGYVIEYSDGRLVVPPVRDEPAPASKAPKKGDPGKSSDRSRKPGKPSEGEASPDGSVSADPEAVANAPDATSEASPAEAPAEPTTEATSPAEEPSAAESAVDETSAEAVTPEPEETPEAAEEPATGDSEPTEVPSAEADDVADKNQPGT